MTFQFVQTEKADHSVRRLCRVLGVSPSGFYAWRMRPESARHQRNRQLRVHIRVAHAESGGTYGSPRVQQALAQAGYRVGRNRVIRLMHTEQLVGRPRRRFRVTTEADPHAAPAPNLLAQHFAVAAPNRVWAADITAVATREGWLYLAVVLDLFSRRVGGWAVDRRVETALVLMAWHQALTRRRTAPQLPHSDRGSQYTSAELAGPGYFYSVNAELPVAEGLTVRFGGTLVPAWFVGGVAGINKLIGRGNHNLALGMGLILRKGSDVRGANASATIGYRYARPGGLFLQLAATPIFDSHGVYPWAGISLGKAY